VARAEHDHFLSVHDYLGRAPERYHPRQGYKLYLDGLNAIHDANPRELAAYLREYQAELDKALGFLSSINRQEWHEQTPHESEPEELRFVDQTILPSYLRIIEGVLHPFLHLQAYFSRARRGKSQEGLEVYATMQEVGRGSLSTLARCYKNTIRNGIAHGGIEYSQDRVTLRDKSGKSEVFPLRSIVRLVDDLVDTCNAIALALKVFLLQHGRRKYPTPQEIMLHELQAETESPWWSVGAALKTQIDSRSQLVIYATCRSRDSLKAQFSTFQTGVLAELLAPGFDRYFISIRSPVAWPGWAAFNGARLRQIRMEDPHDILAFSGAVEDNLIFYVPTPGIPRLVGKIDTFRQSFLISRPLAIAAYREQWKWPEVRVRLATMHSRKLYSVLRGSVVLHLPSGGATKDVVRRACRRIIGAAARAGRSELPLGNHAKYCPIGYARVHVFCRDYRRRRLQGFGLENDLIGTIQVQHIEAISSPDIIGAEVETRGKYRLAWNKAWLDRKTDNYRDMPDGA